MTSNDVRHRAQWIPEDQDKLEEWLEGHVKHVDELDDVALKPSIQAFKDLIDADAVVRMLVQRMVDQEPETREYHARHIRDVDHLLALMNGVMELAPEYGLENVTLPMGAVLDWAMATPAGFAAFRDAKINAALKAVLREWCEFLDSTDSLYVLHDGPNGWKGEDAVADVGMDQFQHDADDEHWGFSSWNDFFIRLFKDGERPVAGEGDDRIVVSACESTPYALRSGVSLHDRFWLEGQPYSLHDMLNGYGDASRFEGGTVYQAFLSATDYHRWHAPISGTILSAETVDGTYFSEADSYGSDAADESPNSQAYLAHVATRSIMVIEADEPALGQVALVAIGMSDVSSCVISVEVGQHVDKAEQLGCFQFGGSTHCLVFEPDALESVALQAVPQPAESDQPVVKVHSHLATARSR